LTPGGIGEKEGEQEAAKKPVANGTSPETETPSKVLEAKRPAAVSVSVPDPSSASAEAAPAEPEAFTGRKAGMVKVEVKGNRYSLRVMRLLQHDQKFVDMEPSTEKLKAAIEDFRKLLQQTQELDPAQDMPDRKQQEAKANQRGGAGTPKSQRGKKNDQPLRDRNGKILEVTCDVLCDNLAPARGR
jgi:hypothetical protein